MTTHTGQTCYILVNKNLKMSNGKIMAQVSHGVLSMHRYMDSNNCDISGWLNNGEKIIVLKSDEKTMSIILNEFAERIPKHNTINVFPIYDAGRTQIESGSFTVLVISPITVDKIPDVIKSLKLF